MGDRWKCHNLTADLKAMSREAEAWAISREGE